MKHVSRRYEDLHIVGNCIPLWNVLSITYLLYMVHTCDPINTCFENIPLFSMQSCSLFLYFMLDRIIIQSGQEIIMPWITHHVHSYSPPDKNFTLVYNSVFWIRINWVVCVWVSILVRINTITTHFIYALEMLLIEIGLVVYFTHRSMQDLRHTYLQWTTSHVRIDSLY
jgi:hypothetical protein